MLALAHIRAVPTLLQAAKAGSKGASASCVFPASLGCFTSEVQKLDKEENYPKSPAHLLQTDRMN